jgi:very-short-patch-repair endonuclease
MTDAEQKLWREIRLAQMGVRFRRQHPVGKFVVDFASLRGKICIEVDGAQHVDRSAYDNARTAFLKSQGYVVLRFTDREVLTQLESVKEAIWNALHPATPPPP